MPQINLLPMFPLHDRKRNYRLILTALATLFIGNSVGMVFFLNTYFVQVTRSTEARYPIDSLSLYPDFVYNKAKEGFDPEISIKLVKERDALVKMVHSMNDVNLSIFSGYNTALGWVLLLCLLNACISVGLLVGVFPIVGKTCDKLTHL